MKNTITQIKNFIIGGGSATAAHYLIMALLVSFEMSPLLATTIGALFGAVLNYIVQYHYTFKSSQSHSRAISSYVLSVSFGFVMNFLLFAFFYESLHFHIILSQLTVTAIVMVMNFTLYKYFIFKPKEST